ncbi:efflux RND transporter periplasmic adaptor subunit [Neorhodopirellula pilleata]|uniref:Macrolide transporter subunit MacA n=1 Tax=Neorhodopirellula pilleata TaxID=2714738 RepID=A0A5C6AV95_9BACT|nr:efflux RND transporter periplasmic adaptor subunit [Neorhodopirellula pilleata]TWU03361.1 macrolide transporter subunit MacA [Neorhodopirellula pilleata]
MRISTRRAPATRRGNTLLILLFFVGVIGVGGWFGYQSYLEDQKKLAPDDLILSEVTQGAFDHTVIEQGEIESSSNTEIICEIEARGNTGTPILWVIDEGAKVKQGDKLIELDSSNLEIELKEDRIEVITAEAGYATAKALVEQAEIAREEYLEGVFKTEERAILSEIAIAEQELRKAQLALGSSERLVAKGLVKSLQLEADKFALANARNQLEAAQGRLKVLQTLTKRKMLVQFDSDIDAQKANLSAAEAKLFEQQQEVAEIEQQIEKCVIYAPTDGVVVHANKYSSRGGNAEFVVEAGAMVRERQSLIRLPDPSKMQVRCKVNESRITLLRRGMPAKIRIDALPGMVLTGRVAKVNRYAEPSSWFSSSIKEYAVNVEIIDPPDVIRTGMTASVEVFVEQIPTATQVPIQAIYEHDNKTYSLVQTGAQSFETREVEILATNETMASIAEGLKPGESAVLNLRQHLTLMNLPEVIVTDNSDMLALSEEAKNVARGSADEEETGLASADAGPGPGGPTADGPSGRPGGSGRPGAGGRPGTGGGPGGGSYQGGGPGGGAPRGEAGGGAGGEGRYQGKPQADASSSSSETPAA